MLIYRVHDEEDYDHEADEFYVTEQEAWNAIVDDVFDSFEFEADYCTVDEHDIECEGGFNDEHYQAYAERYSDGWSVEEVEVNG